jgi:hypothetical protein
MDARTELAQSLGRRYPTHLVARAVLRLVDREGDLVLPDPLREELARLSHPRWGDPAMSDDFDRPAPVTPERLATYERLFGVSPWTAHPSWPADVRGLVGEGLGELGLDCDSAERALADRLWTAASVFSPAGERKRLRFLRRLEQKAARLDDAWRLRRAQMKAKSRLAYAVDPSGLDDLELAYAAYVTARANRRSMFVLGPQSRMRDEIVAGLERLLFARDPAGREAAWGELALVRPVPEVLALCAPERRGELIGTFHAEMTDAALALRDLYGSLPRRMRAEMVAVKGVDSSRWNAHAGALNAMRSAWLNATLACGLDVRDEYLPGKAPRLMASDLAWWYRESGQDLHEDTTLFAALPKPWDVVLGAATLTRADVEAAAERQGVDASTGWTGPRRGEEPERPEPEPALVHGIAVSDPRLAKTLRRCRVFSGREHRYIDELPEDLLRVQVSDGRRVSQPVVGAAERERARLR